MSPLTSLAISDQESSETGGEQSPDQAADLETTVPATEATPSDTPAPEGADDQADDELGMELISPEKFEALKDDPAKLRKALNRAATKKFQELAKERKDLAPYADFIKSLQDDPAETIRRIAPQFDLEFVPKPGEAPVNVETLIANKLKEALGPDYEDLAGRLGPAMAEVIQAGVRDAAKPLLERQNQLIQDSALRESQAAMRAFEKAHPDFPKVQPRMEELSKTFLPAKGMDPLAYMEGLYAMATSTQTAGEATKQALTRMVKSADAAAKDAPLASDKVAVRPVGKPTFQEAYQAAKRGERFA